MVLQGHDLLLELIDLQPLLLHHLAEADEFGLLRHLRPGALWTGIAMQETMLAPGGREECPAAMEKPAVHALSWKR
jgi:hypothetical protein